MKREIEKALEVLGITPPISLKELKGIYRYRAKNASEEELKELSKAYKTLVNFMEQYPFNFCEEEILKSFPDERLKRRFFSDPLWGKR